MTRLLLRLTAAAMMLLLAVPALRAQGDALLTNYWAVPTYYNPGAAGDTDNVRLRGLGRLQWVGIDGAPVTFLAAADMPFKFLDKRWGVGVVAQQEKIGLFRNITVSAQLGFKKKLWQGELTGAVQVGFFNEQFKGSEVFIPDDDDYHQSADDAIPQRDLAGNAFDLGAGVYYVHPRFKTGISVLHATAPTVTFSDDNSQGGATGGTGGTASETAKNYKFTAPRTLYFTAEGNIPVKNTLFEVLPSVLVRSDFTFTDVAATARVRYNKIFSAGLGYRYGDAVSLLLSAEIKGILIGYSYDYHLSDISRASSGSHEIFAGYNLKLDFSEKNRNKHKSIRIM